MYDYVTVNMNEEAPKWRFTTIFFSISYFVSLIYIGITFLFNLMEFSIITKIIFIILMVFCIVHIFILFPVFSNYLAKYLSIDNVPLRWFLTFLPIGVFIALMILLAIVAAIIPESIITNIIYFVLIAGGPFLSFFIFTVRFHRQYPSHN